MKWVDFDNVPGLLDWIAFLLGAAGIGFTIFQLLRSKGALTAAALALNETRLTLVRNQLVSVLPAFEEISRSVDAGLQADDREQTEQALARFSFRAHEAVALLDAATTDFAGLRAEVLAAAEEVSKARSSLFGDATTPLKDLVGGAAGTVRSLAPRIGGAAVSIRNDIGKEKQNA